MTLIHLACAWLLGIYLGSLHQLPVSLLGAVAASCVLGCLALRRFSHLQALCACALALSIGFWRYELARPILTPGPLAQCNDGGSVSIRGWVTNDPVPRDRSSQLVVAAQGLKAGDEWLPMDGLLLVQVPSHATYQYGDELEVSGKLQTPPHGEGFSYRTYLARQGIHSLMTYPRVRLLGRDKGQPLLQSLYDIKRHTRGIIVAVLPEPEAALLTGILVGSDEGIPRSLMDQFRATGTAHIIAISGFNITLIAASLMRLFTRALQRYLALVLAVAVIALYTVFVGAEPPVVRAAIMGGLSALATIVGRRSHAPTALCAAAWAMTAWQPFTLWDVGFELSFASSLGLILYAERLARACEGVLGRVVPEATAQRAAALLQDTLLTTLAAMITTLPLMVHHFGQFSPLSLLANALILPVQPAIMYLGSTAAMLGWICLPLAKLVGWAAWLFLTCTIRTVEMAAQWIDVAGLATAVHPALLLGYYLALAVITLGWRPRLNPVQALRGLLNRGTVRKALLAVLVLCAVLVWVGVASLPDGRLHVTYLDVGQGDAILVQTPSGHRLLIDGGPSPATLLAALGRHLPFWDRRLDVVMLSHPHDDHLRGLLDLPGRYWVRQVLTADLSDPPALHQQWCQQLTQEGIPLLEVQEPVQVDFGDGVCLQVLPPRPVVYESLDETSLVVRLRWREATFLFSGDLESKELLRFHHAGWPLDCTVLKVPHHGSEGAVTEELLAATAPQLAVISVGAENRFGHPGQATLETLERASVRTLRTDVHGTVEITTDGERCWVRTSRRP
jgi:competence protein ComEC